MSRWLYDPETDSRNGKEFKYDMPIHENDVLFNGFSYREIMNVVIANYGHDITEEQFDKAVKEFLDIRIEDMKENYYLYEIRNAGYDISVEISIECGNRFHVLKNGKREIGYVDACICKYILYGAFMAVKELGKAGC